MRHHIEEDIVANTLASGRLSEMAANFLPAATTPSVLMSLLPIIALVFVAYLVIGLAMPSLPLHVHEGLGLSTFVVGLVAGSSFAAAVFSRPWAGHYADNRGSKRAVVIGLLVAVVSGLFYLLSLLFISSPETSVTILILGRLLLGIAERFIITGALSWGMTLGGTQNTGKVISWIGTALYAAFAVGAPAGKVGLDAVFLVSMLVVLCSVAVAMRPLLLARRSG